MKDNGIRKPFNEELWKQTQIKPEDVQLLFPVINLVPKTKEDYEIDCFWVNNKDKPISGIEWEEVTTKSKWESNIFPYETASLLPRKEHYKNLPIPAFFVRLNKNRTDAYVIEINEETLKHAYLKDINRKKDSMSPEGEERINVPLQLTIFGIDNIEPFIVQQYLKRTKTEDKANELFERYRKQRMNTKKPLSALFEAQMKKRNKFLEEAN